MDHGIMINDKRKSITVNFPMRFRAFHTKIIQIKQLLNPFDLVIIN